VLFLLFPFTFSVKPIQEVNLGKNGILYENNSKSNVETKKKKKVQSSPRGSNRKNELWRSSRMLISKAAHQKIELKTDSNELNGHIRAHPGDSRRGEGREKKL
jgi:hypothetical protein